MPTAGIKILFVGKSFDVPYETMLVKDTGSLMGAIARFMPDVIVTSEYQPGPLLQSAFDLRKRWIHVPPDAPPDAVITAVEGCYGFNVWSEHPGQKSNSLISVYTATHNTGDYLKETYQSLVDQSYKNWEWVVLDDHSDDGTWEKLEAYAKEDFRVRPFRAGKNLSKIGAVKNVATRLCAGEFLVELDHDDMLTDFALAEIKAAFASNPEVGFVYSNCSCFFENGQFQRFDDEFWKGRYRDTEYRGKKWLECVSPDIYGRFGPHFTQQHAWYLTVGPNHVRAFRAETFFKLGGYNPRLPVADDWDLMARFFLQSKCHHVDRMLYLYRVRDAWANTTFVRNKSIQDHLALGRARYAAEFESMNTGRPVFQGSPATPLSAPAAPSEDSEEPCFVVASRTGEEGKAFAAQLPGRNVFVKTGARSILEAYEEGRAHWSGRHRIVYVHDDVEFRDLEGFLRAIRKLPPGTHGVCGSAAPDALQKGPWWDCPPLAGKYIQAFRSGGAKPVQWQGAESVREVTWLDGFCLVTVDQKWSWTADGDPEVWHGYDWLACKRTIEAGDKCWTIAQPGAPFLAHRGYGRTEGYDAALGVLRKAEARPTTADVGFVVVDATGSALAARCLRSIREFAPGAQIVLVGNGVVPIKAASELSDKTVLLETNLGFAGGSNRGAMEVSRRVICFMNDDAVFVDDTPAKLAAAASAFRPIVAPFSNRAKPPQGDIPRESTPKEDIHPPMVVGLCMMMPSALFRELGGFDTRLLTWEDDDLCLRAARRGKGCKIVGGTWVEHERHATFKALSIDVDRTMAENRVRFGAMHPKIRVIVIAKDEERAVRDFFEQFQGVTTDWCLLDTGSTDRTVELARAVGARVESAQFLDFASARNEAVRRFGNGADWIIMFDPDERLDRHTLAHLEETLAATPYDILLAPLEAVYPDGRRRTFVPKPFAWRNRPEIQWVFKVHEKLVGTANQAVVLNGKIEHLVALHEDGRRQKAESFYMGLMDSEPYFTDPRYKAKMREEWPILDYDRMSDPRIFGIHAGPLVSVVIPTFDRPKLLERAIGSALGQDYQNVEVVVIGDNCPSGLMGPALRALRVRALNLPTNHGSGGAVPRNYGIMLSAGPFIAYLDDDNVWTPDHVSSLYGALRSAGAEWAFSSMKACGKDLGFSEPKKGELDTSCVLHRKTLIAKHGWWKDRVEAGYAHDWEFFSRWVKEPWAATKNPTLVYNVETCGQRQFLEALAAARP